MGEIPPVGWGFARTHETKIDQNQLDIDADAATIITGTTAISISYPI